MKSRIALATFTLAVVVFHSTGCATAPAKPVQYPDEGATVPERQAVYAKYRLEQHGDRVFGYQWSRSDGDYDPAQIDHLLTEFPETRAIQSESDAQAWTVLGLAVVGGACLGVAIADSLSDEPAFSKETRAVLFASGGALAGAGIVVSLIWQPGAGLDVVYNDALARKLNVPVR